MKRFDSLDNHRVLLIEDDENVREVLRQAFVLMGCRVTAVDSAEDGLAACLEHRHSIIVCDLQLPGMSGLGFFQELTAKEDSVNILISGNAEFGMSLRMRQAGIDAFLAKPFTLEALLAAISNRLRLLNTHSESQPCPQYQSSHSEESGN